MIAAYVTRKLLHPKDFNVFCFAAEVETPSKNAK